MESDIRFDPRYEAMSYEAAIFICDKFSADFGHLSPEQVREHPEGALAISLYAVALGWLVLEDRWEEAGVDSRFVQTLLGPANQDGVNRPIASDLDGRS